MEDWKSGTPVSGGGSWQDGTPLNAQQQGGGGQWSVDNIIRQIAKGASFNLADELDAGIKAPFVAASRKMDGQPFDMGAAYDAVLAEGRARDKAFESAHPVAAPVLQMTGGVAPMFIPGVGAALAPAKGAGMAAQIGKNAAVGAGVGGAYGFGGGEGGFVTRMEDAVQGAALGGALGGIASPLVEGGAYAYQKMAQPILDRMGPASAAGRRVWQALQRDNMSVDDLRAALAQHGPEATIADVGGANLRGLGEVLAQSPGSGAEAAQVLQRRMEGQGNRLSEAVNQGLSGEDVIAGADALSRSRQAASRPLYESAVADANLVDHAAFAPIKSDGFLSDVISQVKGDKLHGMGGLPDNAMPVLDAAKKRIDDMIEVAKRQGENNRVRLLTEKRDTLVGIADGAFPEYAQARAAWAGPSQSMDAMAAGRDFNKVDPRILAKEMAGMDPGNQEFFRAGVADRIKEIISKTQDSADATRRIFGNDRIKEQLRAVFPDEASYNAFAKMLETESLFARNRNQMLGNSRTAFRNAAQEDMAIDPGGAAVHALTGNFGSAVGDLMRQVSRYAKRAPEAVNAELGPMMFTPTGAGGANEAALKALESSAKALDLSAGQRRSLARLLTQSGATGSGYAVTP